MKSFGAVVLSTHNSYVVKIYDPKFYKDRDSGEAAKEAAEEFKNEKEAYIAIKAVLALEHCIAKGVEHGILLPGEISCIMMKEVEGLPLSDCDFDKKTNENKMVIRKKVIEADSNILFQGRVNNHAVRLQNVIPTSGGDIRIIDFGQSRVIDAKIAKAYRNPLFRWVRWAGQWADYGWFESRKKALA